MPVFSSILQIRIWGAIIVSGQILYKKIDISIMADPIVCIRKYLIAASSSLLFCDDRSNGINDMRLISNLIHKIIQFDAVIIIVVEINSDSTNNKKFGDRFLIIIF